MTLDEQKLNLFETTLVGFRCITKFFLCGCSSKNFLKVNRKLFREFFLKKVILKLIIIIFLIKIVLSTQSKRIHS
jgi:hypothetical protein